MVGCRTSGVLTADGVAVAQGCKLVSIHATNVNVATTIYVFDSNTTATGTEIARINLAANQSLSTNEIGAKGGADHFSGSMKAMGFISAPISTTERDDLYNWSLSII